MGVVLDEFAREAKQEAGWAYIKSIVAKHVAQRDIQQRFAELLNEHNRRAESLDVYRRIAESAPKDIGVQVTYADQLDLNAKKDESAKIYSALIARPDISADERMGLRRKFAARSALQGDNAEAIRQYQIIVAASSLDFGATSELARLYILTGHEADALPLYAKLAEQTAYPANVRADMLSREGAILEKLGKKPDAAARFQAALKLNPAEPMAIAGLKRLGVQ